MAAPATLTVFDNLYDSAGNAVANARVQCVLNGNTETTSGGLILPVQQSTTTDASGRFQFTLVGNDLLSPVNSTYTVMTPFRTYDIAPLSTNGTSQQSTAANVIVNTPTPLAPATSSITGNLTISGTLTVSGLVSANGGLTVTGTLSIPAGGFTMAGPLTLTAAASQIIPGATSMSLRDTANANDNLLVSNAGNVTVRGSLTVTGGGLTVSAGGAAITGASTVTGALTVTSTINSQTISAAANLTGTLTVASTLTVTAGGLVVTAGGLTVTAGNFLVTAGTATVRNALSLGPSAGVAPGVATAYGTVQNKIDEQSGSAVASLTVSVPAGGLYRTIIIDIIGRSDQAAPQNVSLQFNGDTAANYDSAFWSDTNTTISGTAPTIAGTSGFCAGVPGTNANAAALGAFRIVIHNADAGQATLRKAWQFHGSYFSSDAAAGSVYEAGQGQWRNTANAVTSIKFIPAAGNFATVRATVRGEP